MIEIVTSGIRGVAEDSFRRRVAQLRAEVKEISRLNKEYRHSGHPLAEVQKRHHERRKRLGQIVAELRLLSNPGR